MDAFVLFPSSQYIVGDEAECLEIEEFRRIYGDSISTKFITEIYSSIDFLIVEIIRSLDDFDRKLIFFREFLHIIDLPGIEIFPDSEINAVESCFLGKFEDQIQSIAGK